MRWAAGQAVAVAGHRKGFCFTIGAKLLLTDELSFVRSINMQRQENTIRMNLSDRD